jgi:hypothetical protein
MCEKYCIDARKLGHLHARSRYPRQEKSELLIEVGICQYTHVTKLEQQGGMSDIGDADRPRARSFYELRVMVSRSRE